jgi:2-keto-4-pentenoate hydratase/2-oxohepta-3-ene-1,7-dioic acid hydratase in catechol pathway
MEMFRDILTSACRRRFAWVRKNCTNPRLPFVFGKQTHFKGHEEIATAMQWARFAFEGEERFGRVSPDGAGIACHDGDMFGAPTANGRLVRMDELALLNPVRPTKLIGLWNNYRQLAAKLGQAIPAEPLYFVKSPNSYLAPGGTIRRPAGYDGKVVYEGELGIVVGRRCRNMDVDEAAAAIFGYTCVNDVTAFDLIDRDPTFAQWVRAKSCDTFAPFGPVVATGLDWRSLTIRTLVNGKERQNYPAADMILPPPSIVSLISRELTLEPGDLIACGTSLGVLPMRPGTIVEVCIDGIGTLRNTFE